MQVGGSDDARRDSGLGKSCRCGRFGRQVRYSRERCVDVDLCTGMNKKEYISGGFAWFGIGPSTHGVVTEAGSSTNGAVKGNS